MPKRIFFKDEENPFDYVGDPSIVRSINVQEYRDETKQPEEIAIQTKEITKTSPTDFSKVASGGDISKKIDEPSTRIITSPIATGSGFKNGVKTKNSADASATQLIAHGLDRTPSKVRIRAIAISQGNNGLYAEANTVYNGVRQSSISLTCSGNGTTSLTARQTFSLNANQANAPADGNYQTGVVTFDNTNIIITWTKTGNPTGTYQLLWEAE